MPFQNVLANALTAYYALMPVFFIFTVTAIKEGIYDVTVKMYDVINL